MSIFPPSYCLHGCLKYLLAISRLPNVHDPAKSVEWKFSCTTSTRPTQSRVKWNSGKVGFLDRFFRFNPKPNVMASLISTWNLFWVSPKLTLHPLTNNHTFWRGLCMASPCWLKLTTSNQNLRQREGKCQRQLFCPKCHFLPFYRSCWDISYYSLLQSE